MVTPSTVLPALVQTRLLLNAASLDDGFHRNIITSNKANNSTHQSTQVENIPILSPLLHIE